MPAGSQVRIREAATHGDLHACVDLQIAVWGFDPKEAVPFNQLHAAHEWGGRVLVACDGPQIVGFVYGFAGRQEGRPALCSHMLAVLPAYRGQDLGLHLKLAQGRWARENGYDLITWTFDPLEAVNANLNINRLGGVARRYLVDHYGPVGEGLISGLPTDRLLVEWRLTAPRVARILAGEAVPPPAPGPDAKTCPIPLRIQAIKAADMAEALRWRLAVREQLAPALAAGYTVTAFRAPAAGGGEGAYLLTRPEEEAEHAD